MSESAMVLTQEEWDDVQHMVEHYKTCTRWAAAPNLPPTQNRYGHADLRPIRRRRELADRIIEANS